MFEANIETFHEVMLERHKNIPSKTKKQLDSNKQYEKPHVMIFPSCAVMISNHQKTGFGWISKPREKENKGLEENSEYT